MAFRLEYEISAIGEAQVRRVLRGVEAEAKAGARRTGRETSALMYGPSRKESAAARAFDAQQAKATAKAQEALDRQRSRSVLANIRTEERERIRAERSASRAAEALDRQRARGLLSLHRASEREQARNMRVRESTARRIGAGAAIGVVGGVGTALRYGTAAAGLVGGFAAADALSDQVQVRRQAALLANQAGNPALKGRIAAEAGNVVGFTGSEKLGAMSAFVGKTGDFGAAEGLIGDLGKLSLVYGANFAEMGEAAGHAFNVLKDSISDPNELRKAVLGTAQTWAAQGAMGTIEIKDMARIAGRMGASTRRFEGDAPGLLSTVGALGQLAAARGGASSAEEAATALARVPGDIVQNQKRFAAAGVDVFSDKSRTKLADPVEILIRALERTGGDLTKINPLFNIESAKVLGGIAPIFADAEAKQKGSGRAAVLAEVGRFKGASVAPEAYDAQFRSMASEESTRVIEAQKAFREKIGTELLPVLTKVIPKFAEAVPHIAKLTAAVASAASYLIDNPFKGVGLIVAGVIAKDLAAAGLQNAISSGISAAFQGGIAGGALKVGAVAVAAGSVTLAIGQWSELMQQTGGTSGLGAGISSFLSGDGFFKGIDNYLNEQARKRGPEVPSSGPMPGMATVGPGGAVLGRQKDGQVVTKAQFDSAAPANQEAFLKTAAELTAAGKALKDAADAIKKNGGPEASRTAPMNSPSRG